MSSVAPALEAQERGSGRLAAACRVELEKLWAQLSSRLLLATCVLAPIAFALTMRFQHAVPADTLFGRWAATTGYATSLTALGFAGSVALPFVAGLVSGDLFAAEDRHGTWKTILTRSCTRGEIFAGKCATAATAAVGLVVVTALSSLISAELFVGTEPLVGLSGQLVGAGRADRLVLAGWAVALPPTLAYVGLGLFLSVATRSGIVGVIGPGIVGLVAQLLALLGPHEIVQNILPSTPFDAWHTIFTDAPAARPLVLGVATSAAYLVLFGSGAWLILRRRDFAGSFTGAHHRWRAMLRSTVVAGGFLALLVAASGWGPTAITSGRLGASVTPTFERLAELQYRWRTLQSPRNAALQATTSCRRGGGGAGGRGAGSDWSCLVRILRPQVKGTGVSLEVTVRANGCYTAQAPPAVVGPMLLRDTRGRTFTNPVYAFDGCLSGV